MANTINLGRVKGSMWYTGTADSASAIATEISSAGYIPIDKDLYLNTANSNIYQYVPSSGGVLTWTLKGNIKGAKGDPFAVAKVYSTVAEMNSGFASDNVKEGQFVIIETGDVNNADNAKLYVKGAKAYEYITDLSGAQGIQGTPGTPGAPGEPGAAGGFATSMDVSVTTLAAGSPATVTVTPDANTPNSAKKFKFVFGIPQGKQGSDGSNGKNGTDGASAGFATTMGVTVNTLAAGSNATVSVTPDTSSPNTAKKFNFEFGIPQGKQGGVGAAAGFAAPTASVNQLTAGEKPTVSVTATGDNTSKKFDFTFGIPQGPKGDKGADGKTPTLSINTNGELIATYE